MNIIILLSSSSGVLLSSQDFLYYFLIIYLYYHQFISLIISILAVFVKYIEFDTQYYTCKSKFSIFWQKIEQTLKKYMEFPRVQRVKIYTSKELSKFMSQQSYCLNSGIYHQQTISTCILHLLHVLCRCNLLSLNAQRYIHSV